MSKKPLIRLLACSVLEKEIRMLQQNQELPYSVEYIDSMYHMHPVQLEEALKQKLHPTEIKAERTVLIFGECHAHMDTMEKRTVARTRGMNCIEVILGKERYRQLRKEGAFFLLPEWAERWRQVFVEELGLNEGNARMFMKEMHQKLIYLDTGVTPVPNQLLLEIAAFTGLPVEIATVKLDQLLASVQEAVKEVSQ